MLRINQNSHADGAKHYYSVADYYTEGHELAGRWRGKTAAMLGLSGEIAKEDWDAMCDRLNPATGEKLFQRRKDNRTIGYDFNFHVPKSVSVLYAMTGDERILDAFRDSVDATMHDTEAEMQTRVRKGGSNEDRVTANAIWGMFIHKTARPIDGVPDPHLHAHCFVHNVTWDSDENRWKAGQFRDLKRDAPYFEAVFHARLSAKLADLGLNIERKARKDWEIAGVPRSVVDKFSRRTAAIEEKARKDGITDPDEKARLGAETRSRKSKNLSARQLQAEWQSRLTPDEADAMARVKKLLGGEARPGDGNAAAKAVDYAVDHEFERRSVVPERVLLTTALRQAVGHATPEQVQTAFDAKELLTHERAGRRMATTRDVLSEESRIIEFAKDGRGTCSQLGKPSHRFKREELNESQRLAVKHILESRDRLILVRGAAGSGKTTLMREAVEAIQDNGGKIVPLAPTAEASRGVLRSEGFSDADTVARLLSDRAFQRRAHGAVWWIDEAGLLGAKTMANVLDLADQLDARVLLTGDKRQHGSVERGAMLRLLEEEAGIKPAEVSEIQRPRGKHEKEYKAIVRALSEGDCAGGFKRLDALGWIKEIPEADRYRQLAADYADAVSQHKTALVVSPTHAEGERITAEIRRLLKDRKQLGIDGRRLLKLTNAQLTEAERGGAVNYRPGDVLQFHQNAKNYRRGQRVTVDGGALPLEYADRFGVFHAASLELAPGDLVRITHNGFSLDGHRLNNGATYRVKGFDDDGNIVLGNGWTVSKDYGHLAHGYVVTSHASQGKTVDRVFVGQSSASGLAASREQFYVSCSRGRESVTVYCDDKEALREAVSQSDERVTAMELLRGDIIREAVQLHRRYEEAAIHPAGGVYRASEREARYRKELVHER